MLVEKTSSPTSTPDLWQLRLSFSEVALSNSANVSKRQKAILLSKNALNGRSLAKNSGILGVKSAVLASTQTSFLVQRIRNAAASISVEQPCAVLDSVAKLIWKWHSSCGRDSWLRAPSTVRMPDFCKSRRSASTSMCTMRGLLLPNGLTPRHTCWVPALRVCSMAAVHENCTLKRRDGTSTTEANDTNLGTTALKDQMEHNIAGHVPYPSTIPMLDMDHEPF